MRALAAPPRRRQPRGAACDEPPRLWGEEPVAVAPPAPVVEAPVSPPAARERPAPAGAAGAPTLEDLITGAWEGLVAGAGVACPVCAAEMAPRWSAGAGVVGGRCGGCGSTLH